MITRSQADKLGERLRHTDPSNEDLLRLGEYRDSFDSFADSLQQRLTEAGFQQAVERRGKSTASIIAKLRRQTTTLSQMQDIVGFRIVTDDLMSQDRALKKLTAIFQGAKIVDRLANPQHGYRAIHLIVSEDGKAAEIQIRTLLQHTWAQLTEKLADALGQEIKYGGGTDENKRLLDLTSQLVQVTEEAELLEHERKAIRREIERRKALDPDVYDGLVIESGEELDAERDRRKALEILNQLIDDLFP